MFVSVPRKFLRSTHLTDAEFRILTELLVRLKDNGEIRIYYKDLAKMSSRGMKDVINLVENLVSKEVVSVVSRRGNLPEVVKLNVCGEVKNTTEDVVYRFKPE